tara:strand:- start:1035 stop:1433 length:399 start_codon:yes stop_codon:yes gene_type:complete
MPSSLRLTRRLELAAFRALYGAADLFSKAFVSAMAITTIAGERLPCPPPRRKHMLTWVSSFAGLGHLGLLMSDITIRAARSELETRGWLSAPPEPAAAAPPDAAQQRRIEATNRELTKLVKGSYPAESRATD